jgi:putative membrane protein
VFLFGLFPNTDILIDIVNFSFIVIVPTLIYSWLKVRNGEYSLHKNIQLTLFAVLFVAVILFEVDLRMRGGIFEMVKDSQFAETFFLMSLIWFHLFVSVTTALIWIGLVIFSLWKFPSPPAPNSFSRIHIFWGKLGIIDMILTGITGVMLYILGFAMIR